LIKAVDRFDPERGLELTTYAVPMIMGEIKRHFRDKAWAVHVPRGVKGLNFRLGRLRETMTAELGRPPTITELAQASHAAEEEVVEALEAAHAYVAQSLSAPLDEESPDGLGDSLGTHEPGYEQVEEGAVIAAGLEALDDRERRIIQLRFFEGLTQSQIAADLGVSQMHVSRLIRHALELMRDRISAASAA
jgi:RNA polymerase sigma-B factor